MEQWLDLVRHPEYEGVDPQVYQDTTEKRGEVEGRIVMMDVESAVHQEEGEVVEGPGQEEE